MAVGKKRKAKQAKPKASTGRTSLEARITDEILTALAYLTGRPVDPATNLSSLSSLFPPGRTRRDIVYDVLSWLRRRGLSVEPLRPQVSYLATVGDLIMLVRAKIPPETMFSTRPKTKSAKKRTKAPKKAAPKKPTAKKAAKKSRERKRAGTGNRTRQVTKKVSPPSPVSRKGAAKAHGVAKKRGRKGARQTSARKAAPVAEAAPSVESIPVESVTIVAPDVPHRRQVASSEPVRPRQPRYANAALLDHEWGSFLDRRSTDFTPSQIVCLRLDIGELSPESQVDEPTEFPERQLPKNVDLNLEVMISSTDFGVAADAPSLVGSQPSIAHGRFLLPGNGGPAMAADGRKYLTFYLRLPPDELEWFARVPQARIGYYFRNILLQSQLLTINLANRRFAIVTDFTTSNDLTGLDNLPERPRISILTNANADGNHQVVLRRLGVSSTAPANGATFAVNSENIGAVIRDLRDKLSTFAPTERPRKARAFADDLRRLAPIGWKLYAQLPGQVPPNFFKELSDKPESAVIQVTRPTSSSFALPWSYIYEIPLFSDVEPVLCPIVEQWDGRKPLFEGMPRQCPCGPHERDVLCPFGFWGYRYSIEQLSSTDKAVDEIPVASNCDVVIGEAQYGISLDKLDAHVKRLRASLTGIAELREGKDKASIETLLGADLPFVYFYCHGERVNSSDPNTCLGVGNREKITASDVIGWTTIWCRRLNKLIWNKVRPLIFINACHSLAIEPETLVSFLQAFVGTGRAAGVIGTEVKVEQTMAMEVAESFVASWIGRGSTVEEALRSIRIDYLKQGNLFGLVYTPYCWSELRIVRASS